LSGWLSSFLKGMGVSLAAVAMLAIPLALGAAAVGWALGKKQERLRVRE
jgi:hypothetical protein